MGSYGPPVDQLLRIKEDPRSGRERRDYHEFGLGPEHIPDLIRMAGDPELNKADGESTEVWGPLHAWRILGLLRAEVAIPTLVNLLADQDDEEYDDWILDDIPKALGMIGPPAIFELTVLLERESANRHSRIAAASSLTEIAQNHPEARGEIVAIIARVLERAEWNEPEFNGFLVSELIDLEAKESAEVIERAYAGEFVDDSICGTWRDVWFDLDLEGDPPPETERLNKLGPYPFLDDEFFDDELLDDEFFEPPPEFPKPESWQPVDRRSPDERKERNKARQKLEKKTKGKGKKPKRR